MTRIPLDPLGYAVNVSTATVHSRYAEHAGKVHRTHDPKRVESMLAGRSISVCSVCYPAPQYERPKGQPQRRRVSKPKA